MRKLITKKRVIGLIAAGALGLATITGTAAWFADSAETQASGSTGFADLEVTDGAGNPCNPTFVQLNPGDSDTKTCVLKNNGTVALDVTYLGVSNLTGAPAGDEGDLLLGINGHMAKAPITSQMPLGSPVTINTIPAGGSLSITLAVELDGDNAENEWQNVTFGFKPQFNAVQDH